MCMNMFVTVQYMRVDKQKCDSSKPNREIQRVHVKRILKFYGIGTVLRAIFICRDFSYRL